MFKNKNQKFEASRLVFFHGGEMQLPEDQVTAEKPAEKPETTPVESLEQRANKLVGKALRTIDALPKKSEHRAVIDERINDVMAAGKEDRMGRLIALGRLSGAVERALSAVKPEERAAVEQGGKVEMTAEQRAEARKEASSFGIAGILQGEATQDTAVAKADEAASTETAQVETRAEAPREVAVALSDVPPQLRARLRDQLAYDPSKTVAEAKVEDVTYKARRTDRGTIGYTKVS